MSWKGIVLNMIEDQPELYDELLDDDSLDEYAVDCAQTMAVQYKVLTRGADETIKATVREFVIAQMREEIEAVAEPPREDEIDPDEAEMFLADFYYGGGTSGAMNRSTDLRMPSVVGYTPP
jgi:hypothetical protein